MSMSQNHLAAAVGRGRVIAVIARYKPARTELPKYPLKRMLML